MLGSKFNLTQTLRVQVLDDDSDSEEEGKKSKLHELSSIYEIQSVKDLDGPGDLISPDMKPEENDLNINFEMSGDNSMLHRDVNDTPNFKKKVDFNHLITNNSPL